MDTITWTNEEIGVYLRLLLYEWINNDLPNNPKMIQKIAKISPKRFQKVFPQIKHKFSCNGQNNLINLRLEAEREKQLNYLKSQSESGRRGAEKKRKLGLFPFSDPSSDPSSDPASDPASEKQALQLQSSSSKEGLSKDKPDEGPSVPFPKLPKVGSKHFTDKLKNAEEIKDICKKVKIPNFNPYQFVQGCANTNMHPSAIYETLEAMINPKEPIRSPYPFARAIIKTKSQNYNEAEHTKQSQAFKVDWGKEYFE